MSGISQRIQRRKDALRLTIVWIVTLLLIGGPLYIVVNTAMKPIEEATTVSVTLPTRFGFFENLAAVVGDGRTLTGFLNSCLITIPTVTLTLLFGAMAAWIFGRSDRRWIQALYYVAISAVMLPPTIITTIRVLQELRIYGTQPGLILFYIGISVGGAIFLMTGFVKNIPLEVEEAARIDGASSLRVFWSVILPSLRPVVLVSLVSIMLSIWNEFFFAYFLLPDRTLQTLPLGLYNFASANTYQFNWGLIFTHVIIVSLPLIIVFLFAQKSIISGLLGGAVK